MIGIKSVYKMTELGEIPVNWEVYKLGRYVKLQGGYAFKSSKFSDEGIKILRISNIKERGLSLNECKYYSDKDIVGLDDYYLKENDTVIAMSGATTGKSTLVKKSDLPLLVNQRVGTYKQKNEAKVDQKFIHYIVLSDYYQQKLWEHAIGGAQPNISSSQLESIVIAYPPLKEQQKIAEILSTVDKQIEQTDQLIEKTKELKKGLMQQLLTKGIGHTAFKKSEFGKIPTDWNINKVEYICDYRKEKIDPLKSERKKYIALENIEQNTGRINGYLHSDDSTSMKSIFKKGDTIFNKLRPYLNKYWYATFDGVCATELLPLTSKNETDSLFLYYCLQQERVLGYVTKRTFGTKMPRTSWKELKEIVIPIPPVKEQKKIASILSSVDEDIEGYVQEKSKHEELKKGLMQQLLTGKTRVKVD